MPYAAVTVEGGLFPAELLDGIGSGSTPLPVSSRLGHDQHRLVDEIQAAFSDARSYWDSFQRRLDRTQTSGTSESILTITRQDWMLKFLELIGFSQISFQRAALESAGQLYLISHRTGDYEDAPPVHIVAIDQELDRMANTGRRISPHALVQEYLNRSEPLWGIVTNGRQLRLLRDTARLSKPTYLEFNLEGMMEGNQYSEFALLYRLIHSSHFPQPEANPQDCALEKYYQEGLEQGGRVREKLRDGVATALETLGSAFLKHPDSVELREKLATNQLDTANYYRQLLRLVYRFLFLMVSEERHLLFSQGTTISPKQNIYRDYYSIARIRDRAERYFRGDTHSDLWIGLRNTFLLFRDDNSAKTLDIAALNGELFGATGCPDLEEAHCTNQDLLSAVLQLSTFLDDGRETIRRGSPVRRRVNYAGLDVEELGSVYESLLEFQPQVSLASQEFTFVFGSDRKTTGSYYTPPELVRELINSALVPVIEDRLQNPSNQQDRENALLTMTVCDPASGSGHFLLAASRRIARELAQVRSGDQEPSPTEYRIALRDVIRNCIYGVDKNPLAVDLCKVALWIEGHNPGLPLSFLDNHVKCGDSLVGVLDLGVLDEGIPDDAYKPVEGDDKRAATAYRKQNDRERKGQRQLALGESEEAVVVGTTIAENFRALGDIAEGTAEDVNTKKALYDDLRAEGSEWWKLKVACDLWTSAFFMPLQQEDTFHMEGVPTTGTLRQYLTTGELNSNLLIEVEKTSEAQSFFHWKLEFPDVFEKGGFDAVLGNPPFLGGLKISSSNGPRLRKYLQIAFTPAGGTTDLCAYFFRQSFELLGENKLMGLVSTNSISKGDTREGGLATIVKKGGSIVFAHRFIKWPGTAAVEVNLIAVRNGEAQITPTLDGSSAPYISSRLDEESEFDPNPLRRNEKKAFIGVYLRGTGFILDIDKAESLFQSNPKNYDCLLPYLNGDDINTRHDQSPSRFVINFLNRDLDSAMAYPELLSIVEQKVKPEREKVKEKIDREKWWLFARTRPELYEAVAKLTRVLVRSRHSGIHALVFEPNGIIYSDATVVFAFDDFLHFALLQSNVHETWLKRQASTLGATIRYTPEDCYDTFALPQDISKDIAESATYIGEKYYKHRHQIMQSRNIGLTKTYNLFNDPICRDDDIRGLRDLHTAMDDAVLACYDWDDLKLNQDFQENSRGEVGFTISPDSNRELLNRLLNLNSLISSQELGGN